MQENPQEKPETVMETTDNPLLDKAIKANERRKYFQLILTSPALKLTATGFLLISLFCATFLIAYQKVQSNYAKEALKNVPDAEIILPQFTATPTPQAQSTCLVTGCSGELCSDHEVVSPCVYVKQYACYKTAKCQMQEDGECGWTPTAELRACIAKQ